MTDTDAPRRTSLDDFIQTIQATFHDNLAYFQQDTEDFAVHVDSQPLDFPNLPPALTFDISSLAPGPSSAASPFVPFQHDSDSDSSSSSESEVEEVLLPDPEARDNVKVASYANDTLDNTPYIADDYAFTAQYTEPLLPTPKIYTDDAFISTHPQTPALPSFHDSDLDADGETDDDCGTDDEYVPSPSENSRKRRRAHSPRLPTPTLSRYNSRASSPQPPTKRPRASPPSRNIQVSTPVVIPEGQYTCPHCGWEQANKRAPDFARHLRTHTRPSNTDHNVGWWCKGVELSQADVYGVDPDATPYEFRGQLRVGGCLKTFSRRDALKRHLDNKNVHCVGHPVAANED